MQRKSEILLEHEPDEPVGSREKLEGGKKFVLNTECTPAGDQPSAIKQLVNGILANEQDQVLLGATGTGKTFTRAHIIESTQKPAIILAPNKANSFATYLPIPFEAPVTRIFLPVKKFFSELLEAINLRYFLNNFFW